MGVFDQFPYTNFHELNLDWILQALKDIEKTMDHFVSINALKYADPIQWDITTQYEKNTIVIEPNSGTAYISVQAVPAGVSIANTDYWTVVFDLGMFVVRAAKNLASKYEEDTTNTATQAININEWFIWGDTLYRALTNIIAGDQFVIDSNIEHFTIESITGHNEDLTTTDKTNLVTAINEIVQTIINEVTRIDNTTGDLDNLNTTDKTNLVAAINEVNNTGGGTKDLIGDLNNLNTTDKSNLVAALNEVLSDLTTTAGDLDNLNTTDKNNLVAAINEVLNVLNTTEGDLNDLDTTDKSNLVAAINEVFNIVDSLDLSIYQRFVSFPYFENIGVLHTYRATDEIIGQDICKIDNTLLLANRGTVTGLNANSHIYSIDLTTGTYTSVVLPIGHGNGMTYNPDDGMLYICPLDPTTVGGKYVIHRVNYPDMTMNSDVYTDEYYASLAYNPTRHNFVGMRRNDPTNFDILDENLFVLDTISINVQGTGQTLCAYDNLIYILESSPNKISVATYDGDVLWGYVAETNFAQYILGEFNGIDFDNTTGELYIGNNINYGNGFLVSSYSFFKVNLYNNNVIQKELESNYYAEEYQTIHVASNNTIFEYGTTSNPVSLLEYAIAMAHVVDNPAILFDENYDSVNPIKIISMVQPLVFNCGAGMTVQIKGLTIFSSNWIVFRNMTFNGQCIDTPAVGLFNDCNIAFQNCTFDKVAAGVGTEIVLNRGQLIAPSSPFSGYTISGSVNSIVLS